MKVVGRQKLLAYASEQEEVRPTLAAWLNEVEVARWLQAEDVRSRFPNVRMVDDCHALFLLLDRRYSVEALVSYRTQILVIQQVAHVSTTLNLFDEEVT